MLKKYKNIFLVQIITWVVAFNVIAIIRFSGMSMAIAILDMEIETNPLFMMAVNSVVGVFLGILLSFADIFILKTSRKRRLFIYHILRKSTIYIITIILGTSLFSVTFVIVFNLTIQQYFEGFFSYMTLSYFIGAVIVSIFSSFVGQVNTLLGPDKVWKLFLGMYYNPKEEFRVFLFIDLRNSTEHAEEMGRKRYSQFIQDFMFRVNLLIRRYEAEIYQYVGDEVVLTWTREKGLRNENCVQFFFALEHAIKDDLEYFQEKYGLIPEFKAGLNAGKVIIAEVGRVKKEIAYHGGTIITASRIQEQCNYYGVNILAGESILELMPEPESFKTDFVGEVRLKGKSRNKKIYAIREG